VIGWHGPWHRGHVTGRDQSHRQHCVAKGVARRGARSGNYLLLIDHCYADET